MKKSIILLILFLVCNYTWSQDWVNFNNSNSAIPFNKIYSMDISSIGEIWIGNDVSGSFDHAGCFNGTSWEGHISSGWVNDLSADYSGNVWLSSYGELKKWDGLNWYSYSPPSGSLSWWASPVCTDLDGYVWILNSTSLWKFDGVTWTEYTTSNSDLPSYNINAMCNDDGNVFFATSDQGLVYFDNGTWTSYNTTNSSIPDDNILSVDVLNGEVWIVTQNGNLSNLYNGSFTSYPSAALSSTMDIAIDYDNNIWIATHGQGLYKFNGQDFINISATNQTLNDPYSQYLSVEVDTANNIWVGSRSAGLFVFYSPEVSDTQIEPDRAIEIFFLGNSFTGANDLPGIVNAMAIAADQPCYIESHAPGGQFSTDHCTNPFVYEKINSRQWDYVVIQDNQGAFVNLPPYVGTTTIDANTQLYDSIKSNNICTSVLWFAGWAGEGGYPQYFPGDNTEYCIERLLANVVYMNSFMGEVVAPIGEGWIRSLTEQPTIDLYSPDGAHPSMEGSFLTASVLYSLIFKTNPVNINYDGGLGSSEALFLKQVGYDVVVDDNTLDEYNISSITPEIIFDVNQFTATQSYSAYQWGFATDILAGETNNYLSYIDPGIYNLYVLDGDNCQRRSFDQGFGSITTAEFSFTEVNGTVTFTNLSVNAQSCNWDFGDGYSSNEENPVHNYSAAGDFTVTLTCTGVGTAVATEQLTITLSISIEEDDINISIYPNPCHESFQIQNTSSEIINSIQIFDAVGKIILSKSGELSPNSIIKIDIDELNSGLYFVSLQSTYTNYKLPLVIR